MSFPEDFCDGYQPHEDVESFVDNRNTDPDARFHDFHFRYKIWKDNGRQPEKMGFYFGSTSDARRALKLGDGAPEGRVIGTDCSAFVGFVNRGENAVLELAAVSPEGEEAFLANRSVRNYSFEDAVLTYLLYDDLPDDARDYLNGACFLRNEMENTNLPGGEKADIKEFYAIPGFEMLFRFQRPLSVNLWDIALDALEKASEVADMRMINLDMAMQLRLGREGDLEYPPKTIGSGFVIFGAR